MIVNHDDTTAARSIDCLKIMSFNILAPCWADPSLYPKDSWPYLDRVYRRDKIINFLLANSDVDVIALQEVTTIEFGFINAVLMNEYQGFQSLHAMDYWSNWITHNVPWEPNGNALFLKKTTFKNIAFNDVLLSDDGNHAAIAMAVHRLTNKNVQVLSVHLDSDHAYNREREFQAALGLMVESSAQIDIIAGDFNIDITKANLSQDITKANFVNVLHEMGVNEVTSPYLGMYYANSVYGPIDSVLARNVVPNNANVFDFGLFRIYPNKKDETMRIVANFQRCGSDHFPISGTVKID